MKGGKKMKPEMKVREKLRKIWRKFFPEKVKVTPERVVILIDGENLWYSLIELGNLEISDFKEFKNRLVGGKELARLPVYYRSVDMEEPEQTLKIFGFLAYLENQRYEVKYKPLLKGKEPKSEIDPLIAVDICRMALEKDVSTIILVSGDRHFVEALVFAKERGKKIRVVSTAPSKELKKVSDEVLDLKEIIRGITRKSKIEEKRAEALEKIKEGKKISLPKLEEIPKN